MKNTVTDVVVYGAIVSAIFLMTAPKSQGPKLVSNVMGGYANLVRAETGQKSH